MPSSQHSFRSPSRARVVFLLCVVFLAGCTALIGTRDLLFVDETAQGDAATDGGTSVDGASLDANVDTGPVSCGDTQTSSAHCGRCGHDCFGGACEAGVCQPVKINGDAGLEPFAIAVDDTHVFFSDIGESTGSLYRVPKDGSTRPEKIATTTDSLLYDLKLDGTTAYISSGSYYADAGAVEMVPKDGGAKTTIARGWPNASDPRGVTIDNQYVYWVNYNTPTDVKRGNRVASSPITTLAANEEEPTLALVDGSLLWWTSKMLNQPGQGKLRRCTLPACSDRYDLTTGLTEPDVLAQNALRIFYNSGNTVMQIAKNALYGPGAVVAANQSLPASIAADDREIYWIDLGDYQQSWVDGTIRRCPVVTGAADCSSTPNGEGEIIARPGALMARGIAIDATAVYWTEQETPAVYRLAR